MRVVTASGRSARLQDMLNDSGAITLDSDDGMHRIEESQRPGPRMAVARSKEEPR
jgi:hypothetical protein